MGNTSNTTKKANELLKAIDIAIKMYNKSPSISLKQKESSIKHCEWIKNRVKEGLKKGELKSGHLNSFVTIFFTPWNEGIGVDVEYFWLDLKNSNILEFARKHPLRFALKKGYFLNVEQGMEARKNWYWLIKTNILTLNYTEEEIKSLQNVIESDEFKRLQLLQKCLKNKRISSSEYLRFGDCIAYFDNCKLFEKYFTELQISELDIIWKNVKFD